MVPPNLMTSVILNVDNGILSVMHSIIRTLLLRATFVNVKTFTIRLLSNLCQLLFSSSLQLYTPSLADVTSIDK